MMTARYYDIRREIEAILDDTTLPRYLQVSYIIELFDPEGRADTSDFWPDEAPAASEEKVDRTDESSRPKRPTRKKRAKTTNRRG